MAVAMTALSGLMAAPAHADAAGSGLVINEVYGGGGNSGATFTNDYIELFNPTDAAVDVSGWSVSYYSAKGNLGGATPLSGPVPAHGYYLVQEAQGAGGTAPLPAPDSTGQLALSATAGSVTLSDASDAVVDTVGFGTGTIVEGGDAPAPSNTTAVTRSTPGVDTDDNRADFTTGPPAPINSAGETGGGDTSGDAGDVTIAQIQGTDTDSSPLAGRTATTTGVVTAVYATGGFNGFYIETGGAGGTTADDRTPGASDAVFVYGSRSVGDVTVGESVQVRGTIQEFAGETEISFPTVTRLSTPLPDVAADRIAWGDLQSDAQKEAHEGELVAPQGDFTVTDNYDTNFYGQVELAAGDHTLRQPTDAGPAGSAAAQQAADYNTAHTITLDDGASVSYTPTGPVANDPLPWLTADNPVSVGAKASFHKPVVLDYRNSLWSFQPTAQVSGTGADTVSFSDMRGQSARPRPSAARSASRPSTWRITSR